MAQIDKTDVIAFPIHEPLDKSGSTTGGGHWTLAILILRSKTALYHDSAKGVGHFDDFRKVCKRTSNNYEGSLMENPALYYRCFQNR